MSLSALNLITAFIYVCGAFTMEMLSAHGYKGTKPMSLIFMFLGVLNAGIALVNLANGA